MADAYPLAWPDGWPRTPEAEQKNGDHSFKRPSSDKGWSQPWTFAAARDALRDEIFRHTGGAPSVISSNFPAGRDGPLDKGIAIYFQRNGRPYAMACDRYGDAQGNMRSLTLALEAMRQLERHGGGVMMERAFQGFTALPPPRSCWEILGLSPNATAGDVQSAWRGKIGAAHPDRHGGSQAAASELNKARDDALKLIGAQSQ